MAVGIAISPSRVHAKWHGVPSGYPRAMKGYPSASDPIKIDGCQLCTLRGGDKVAKNQYLEEPLIAKFEQELRQLGSKLHDDLGQHLAAILVLFGNIRRQSALSQSADPEELNDLYQYCTQALEIALDLARSCYPMELETLGLEISLLELARRVTEQVNAEVDVNYSKGFRANPASEIHLYRIVQDTIALAIQNGSARRIVVEAGKYRGKMRLLVCITGLRVTPPSPGLLIGTYLKTQIYRAITIGATLEIMDVNNKGECKVAFIFPAHHPQS